MEGYKDAIALLEDSFLVARSVGPFFVWWGKKDGIAKLGPAVKERVRDIWPRRTPISGWPVNIRIFSWEKERPSTLDEMPFATDIILTVSRSIVEAGMVADLKQVSGVWFMRDHYRDTPADLLSIQISWGI